MVISNQENRYPRHRVIIEYIILLERSFLIVCQGVRREGGGGLNLHFLNSLNSNLCQYFGSSYVDNICLWFLIKMPHDNPPPPH